MRPEDRKNILLTGIFVSVLLVITAISLFLISKENKLFSTKSIVNTTVSNAQSLREGAAVHFKGIKVGSVNKIEIISVTEINFRLQIETEYLRWIKTDSHIAFRTQGVLGDKYLEILGGGEESPAIADGAHLITDENSQFDKFINQGEDVLVVAGRILQKLDTILGPVDNNRITNILNNLEKSSDKMNKVFSAVEPKSLANTISGLGKASQTLGNVMERVEKGPGSAHSLIYDPTVHEDLKALLGGAQRSRVLQYFIRETIKENNE